MYKYLLIVPLLFASMEANISSNKSTLESPSSIEILTKEELELLKCNLLSECLESATGISSFNGGDGDIFQTITIAGNTLANYNTNTLLLVPCT